MGTLSRSRLLLTTTVFGLAFCSTWVVAQERVRWKHVSSQTSDLAAPGVAGRPRHLCSTSTGAEPARPNLLLFFVDNVD